MHLNTATHVVLQSVYKEEQERSLLSNSTCKVPALEFSLHIQKDKERARGTDRDVRGAEIVKAIKTYSTSALTPCPPRYPPAQNSYSLPN